MMRRAPIVLLALAVTACGYALAGRASSLPEHIKRIGVPMFENHSDTTDLDRILTEAVRQELQGRGRFVVVQDTTGVDAVLTGEVRPIASTVAAFTDTTRQASKYLITIQASVEFKDLKEGKVLFPTRVIRASDDYEVTSTAAGNDPAALFSQDQSALRRLAKTFAQSLVTQILENF